MKILFAGTPKFATVALDALIQAGYPVAAVLTQPDRPAGRGMQLTASPVKQYALLNGLAVLQPASLKEETIQRVLRDFRADVMVVAAYGLILPQAVLEIPRYGCLNIHASLLPRWRGAAPIQRAILAGDRETGITIMQMDAGLDSGDLLLQKRCPISATDTAQTLHDKLAALGAESLLEALQGLASGTLRPQRQDESQACYASKITKAEARLDWSRPAYELARAVRAYNPFPVAHTEWRGTVIKIWQARPTMGTGIAGTVLAVGKAGIEVACGEGALLLEILQKPGGKPLPAGQFMQGFPLRAGDRLGVETT